MDDRFSGENWDPRDYEPEPDLKNGYRNAPRAPISDRNNAAIFYALEEFYKNMAEHEVSMGREFTAAEKHRHIQRFEGMLYRTYGASRPDGDWLSRHEAWHERNQGGHQ